MGQYECHVFVCTSGDTCPEQGDVEGYVKTLRAGVQKAGKQVDVRVWQQKLLRIERQVCLVEIAGTPLGTGFLVGPAAVLTKAVLRAARGKLLIDASTAGRIVLGGEDKPITVRARLKAAAKAEGKPLEIQRKDDAIVFWLRGAGEAL